MGCSNLYLYFIPGVALKLINGAEHFMWVELVHERTRPIVDGFVNYRHVVRVHDTVNEANCTVDGLIIAW